ncbi:ATP:ADP Antiporter (AAA) Family [Trachipleistophora hominis]|uniref:ATP:ADP Antiporter (AAA) Family n=1 Tax=Trachipleistophora hominis TaxID=72359 RepID=L7JTX7_TRAHO|nr:ATP:ADP Antiporter (AAA) Family [Trachipleistophora hominis]
MSVPCLESSALTNSSSAVLSNNPSARNNKSFTTWKVKICAIMAFICYVIIYSSRNLLNGLILSRQGPITKLVSIALYVQPLSLISSLWIRRQLRQYTIRQLLDHALLAFAIYFSLINFILVKFRHVIDADSFYINDFLSDGKSLYKRVDLLFVALSTVTSPTITVQYTMIVIFEFVVQYVLVFSFFNDLFSQKQFNSFISILCVCDVAGSFLSSIISSLYSGLGNLIGAHMIDTMQIAFFLMVSALCFVLLYLTKEIQKSTQQECAAELDDQFKIRVDNSDESVSLTTMGVISCILRNRFIRSISFYVIFFFFINELLYASLETTICGMNGSTSEAVSSSVTRTTSIIRGVSSCVILVFLLSSLSRWLITHKWTLLVYTTPLWCFFSCITIFMLDTVRAGIEGLSLSFINRKTSFLNDADFIFFKDHLESATLVISVVVCIFLKIVKTVAFFMSKETLTMMVDRKVRSRIRPIYDGMCPLIGKSLAAITMVVCAEIMETYNARVFSIFLLVISVFVVLYWLKNARYLCLRYMNDVYTG